MDTTRLHEDFGYVPRYTTREALRDFQTGRRLRQVVSQERMEQWERDAYAFLRRKRQERFEESKA